MKSRPQSWPRSHFVDDFQGGHRQSPRCAARLHLSLRFGLSLIDVSDADAPHTELSGETRDLSETGLSVSLPSNHIGEQYFNVFGCTLRVTLELPDGPVEIRATPKWCRWFWEGETARSYLLGLRIIEMTDEEWVRLVRYVHACL